MKKTWIILAILGLGCGTVSVVWATETADCFACHEDAELVGEALRIDPTGFHNTPHADMGCGACHVGVRVEHRDTGQMLDRATCGDCHAEVVSEYGETSHAANAVCVDCHNPHAVRGLDEVSGYDMNRSCATCHDAAVMEENHRHWLPQTGVHLAALPCISCHTGSEKLVLELYLTRSNSKTLEGDFQLATHAELLALGQGVDPVWLLDTNRNRRISLDELRAFNRNSAYAGFRLQGLMVPAGQTHSYDILYNRWDCSFCHRNGPAALQTSYLGMPQSDGSYQRLPIEEGAVLTVLYTTPDFYMIGSTRNTALNLAGALIVAAGLVMPVGHGFLRFLTRKNRN